MSDEKLVSAVRALVGTGEHREAMGKHVRLLDALRDALVEHDGAGPCRPEATPVEHPELAVIADGPWWRVAGPVRGSADYARADLAALELHLSGRSTTSSKGRGPSATAPAGSPDAGTLLTAIASAVEELKIARDRLSDTSDIVAERAFDDVDGAICTLEGALRQRRSEATPGPEAFALGAKVYMRGSARQQGTIVAVNESGPDADLVKVQWDPPPTPACFVFNRHRDLEPVERGRAAPSPIEQPQRETCSCCQAIREVLTEAGVDASDTNIQPAVLVRRALAASRDAGWNAAIDEAAELFEDTDWLDESAMPGESFPRCARMVRALRNPGRAAAKTGGGT